MAKNKKKLNKKPKSSPTDGADIGNDDINNEGDIVAEEEETIESETQDVNGSSEIVENGLPSKVDSEQAMKIKLLEEKVASLTIELKNRDEQLLHLKNVYVNGESGENGTKEENERNSAQDESVQELSDKLAAAIDERDEIQRSYDALLGRLQSVKTIFNKLKVAESELEETKDTLALAVDENASLKEKIQVLAAMETKNEHDSAVVKKLKEQNEDLNGECDRLSDSLTKTRREYQLQLEELQDEKYSLENQNSKLSKKINELKVEISEFNLIRDELNMENKNSLLKIEELNDKITGRDTEISQLYSTIKELERANNEKQLAFNSAEVKYKSQIELLEKALAAAKAESVSKLKELAQAQEQIEQLKVESKEAEQLKVEINNKQLIIGKLRHEAIILNEHLTKSLTMLKQHGGEGNKTIDKELISNVVISFLQFPRGDTKKFEALQLISALLEWSESQRVAAGLSHTGPASKSEDGDKQKQSFVNLWTDFLEKESSGK